MVTPWNFPLMQAVLKVAPAMAAGCTMVLKPSPWASLTCIMLGDVARSAGAPPGVLNVITGGPPGSDSGEHLVTHDGIDYLSFTGSGNTGKHLLHASADKLRPSGIELGGKGAMVVFPDADLHSVVDWAMCGIFICSGQVCSATSRLIVHESIEEELMDMLVARTNTIKVGHPLLETTQMGPLVSKEQHAKVSAAIAQVYGEGCSILSLLITHFITFPAHPPARLGTCRRLYCSSWGGVPGVQVRRCTGALRRLLCGADHPLAGDVCARGW
jgi:betaine-aldehyde dehydrogenase